jgi:hypothetical protein
LNPEQLYKYWLKVMDIGHLHVIHDLSRIPVAIFAMAGLVGYLPWPGLTDPCWLETEPRKSLPSKLPELAAHR